MVIFSLRMFNRPPYFILLTYIILGFQIMEYTNGNHISENRSNNTLVSRYKRSYERHKSKDTLTKNSVVKDTSTAKSSGSSLFVTDNCTVVVAQIGGTATLPCTVRKFNNGVVSWIRKRDYHLLTVGLATYNTGDRFLVEHVRHLQNWGLLIKKVQFSDAGLYECQMSTHPPSSIIVELRVTKALAEIQGAPDLYIHSGSRLQLVCTLRDSTETPEYVFWFHEQRMINYDPGVYVQDGRSSSVIYIQEADKSHNGNYTCSPSNAVPASINVHVLNATAEEKPAAMQHANTSSSIMFFFVRYGVVLVILRLIFQKT
ncbi:uncharacterized protein LOC130896607 [Diorhabda carinulata]|uniref:uncharacterized protein LOC130896607 n=1 Tax=Diorhabda carinulata TaxID=1163345 RepID=UPI0025A02D04|nr:uncharacterized protein LOC130896607 [Diorhabda carinulata]